MTKKLFKKSTSAALLVSSISLMAGCRGAGDSEEAEINAADFPGHETQVINGTPGLHEDFPSIIAMTYFGLEMCTGTLIRPDFILTAAHCVPYLEKAVYGLSDISEACDDCSRDVFLAVDHASFDPYQDYFWKDVGWALLEKPFENAVTAEILPKEAFPQALEVGKMVTIAGYGENGVMDSGNLFYGVVPITSFFTENGPVSNPFQSLEEMAVGLDDPAAPNLCYGDSGGPTYIEIDSKKYLTGITSRIPPDMPQQCGHGAVVTLPGAFANLTDERYLALLKCRDEGDCSDVYGGVGGSGGGSGIGGNNEGGNDESGGGGGARNPLPENHREPFVMIGDTDCNYSGRSGRDENGLLLLLAPLLLYGLRKRK